jgi:hypothetical protein
MLSGIGWVAVQELMGPTFFNDGTQRLEEPFSSSQGEKQCGVLYVVVAKTITMQPNEHVAVGLALKWDRSTSMCILASKSYNVYI